MNRKEILIVEDEETLLRLQSLLLTARGYQVKAVADGKLALEHMASHMPDLVLLDVMLPEVDGFEVCRRIKSAEATARIPVILVSAKKSREDLARGEQVGADWYITKPFKSSLLVEAVQRFLSGDPHPAPC